MIVGIAALVFIGLVVVVATQSNRRPRRGGRSDTADTNWSTPAGGAYYASDGGDRGHDSGADGGADGGADSSGGGGGSDGGSDGGGGCGGGGCGGGGSS